MYADQEEDKEPANYSTDAVSILQPYCCATFANTDIYRREKQVK